MNVLTYPLRYLALKDESGRALFLRNKLSIVSLTIIIAAPFIFAHLNFFGDRGFLDRIGSFLSVLTGFYIAALVGIASFASTLGDLDEVIESGKIKINPGTENEVDLTRRQYVCIMFGYLSFISLFLSVFSVLAISIVETRGIITELLKYDFCKNLKWIYIPLRMTLILLFCVVISHMLLTTCHGLYYLIDRLYTKKAVLLKKRT